MLAYEGKLQYPSKKTSHDKQRYYPSYEAEV